jgi:HlyD family secretion protein
MKVGVGTAFAGLAALCAVAGAALWIAGHPGSVAALGLGEAAAQEPPGVSSAPPHPDRVSALGRLEPEDGVIRVAGPSSPSVVIAKLFVDDGDRVKKGQLLATLDTAGMLEAAVRRLQAELDNARRELARHQELHRDKVVSDSQREAFELRVRVAEAELARARAELDLAHVRSPLDGQVLKVHAREGERVGPDGIVELGKTDHMFAIAEVYEEDVRNVRVGAHAVVTSPALSVPLEGNVDWVNLRVAKQDAIGNDPAARKDARVVEVKIRLADSRPAAGLTNLQVEVAIEP